MVVGRSAGRCPQLAGSSVGFLDGRQGRVGGDSDANASRAAFFCAATIRAEIAAMYGRTCG